MTKIKLNDQTINSSDREYELDPTEEYLINLEEEMEFQMATMMSIQIMGAPPALKNYHAWLFENGFDVPKSLVLSRELPPFTFGKTIDNNQPLWTRTAPKQKDSGRFHTSSKWQDPFLLMQKEEEKCDNDINIASLIIQQGIEAKYSGAGLLNKEIKIIEAVKGYGDDFMLGLKSNKEDVAHLFKDSFIDTLLKVFSNCSFEWVIDNKDSIWIVQVNQIKGEFTEHDIVLGDCKEYIYFDTDKGLDELRELIQTIKGKDVGINLIGNVGVTSHFGDILRINNIVSKITKK